MVGYILFRRVSLKSCFFLASLPIITFSFRGMDSSRRVIQLPFPPSLFARHVSHVSSSFLLLTHPLLLDFRFVSDCMGHPTLIADHTFNTKLPAEVDEEKFNPSSTSLPVPTSDEQCENSSAYMVLKCRYASVQVFVTELKLPPLFLLTFCYPILPRVYPTIFLSPLLF